MEVILLKDVTDLGKQGEVVHVKAGYARKHLLPNGVAVTATNLGGQIVKNVIVRRKAGQYVRLKGLKKNVRVGGVIVEGIPPDDSVEPAGNGFPSVLEQLRTARGEVQEAYSDVAHRELTWRTFQELASGPLWAAVEQMEDDPYRQQLADVLDAAVSKLEAFQLDEKHFSAIDSTLSKLSAPTVSEDAVDACERKWEAAEITTVPALRSDFEAWLTSSHSGIEDGE